MRTHTHTPLYMWVHGCARLVIIRFRPFAISDSEGSGSRPGIERRRAVGCHHLPSHDRWFRVYRHLGLIRVRVQDLAWLSVLISTPELLKRLWVEAASTTGMWRTEP